MSEIQVDSNCNRIYVKGTGLTLDGKALLVVRLVGEPERGYIALDEGDGAFGNEACPSSYHMPCMTWFGPGERYPDPGSAVVAIADQTRQED